MFCKYCGKELPESAVYCSGCGQKIQDTQGSEHNNISEDNNKNETNIKDTLKKYGVGATTEFGFVVFLLIVSVVSIGAIYLIAATFYFESSKMLWISYVLCVLTCAVDYLALVQKDPENKVLQRYLIIVPLYLIKRAELSKEKKWVSAVLWTGIYIIVLFSPIGLWARFLGTNPSVIDVVRKGSFSKYPDVTVGELVEETFDNYQWSTNMGAYSKVIVTVYGTIDGRYVFITFEVNMNNHFSIVENEKEKVAYIDAMYKIYKARE